ncbi:hypothetical protein [Acinetobacter phage AB1I1M-1]
METKAPKIENVQVEITRTTESNGNVQFWARARRLDAVQTFGLLLEYNCFQTKYNGHTATEDECIDRAVLSVKYLLEFFGHTKDDLKLNGLTEENMKSFDEYVKFWRLK